MWSGAEQLFVQSMLELVQKGFPIESSPTPGVVSVRTEEVARYCLHGICVTEYFTWCGKKIRVSVSMCGRGKRIHGCCKFSADSMHLGVQVAVHSVCVAQHLTQLRPHLRNGGVPSKLIRSEY